MKIENIGEYLKQHDVKPSYQRIKIFEYLVKHRNHPTVDTIYKELLMDIPTLSKTTVYNTLKLFLGKNIVHLLNIEEHESRFDADTSLHGHFKCETCGNVYDFDVDISNVKLKNIELYKIKETHFYLKGICQNCQYKKSNNNN